MITILIGMRDPVRAEMSAVSVVGKKSARYFIPSRVGFSHSDGNARAEKLKLKQTVDLVRVSVLTLEFYRSRIETSAGACIRYLTLKRVAFCVYINNNYYSA